jgi:hypothetical protein
VAELCVGVNATRMHDGFVRDGGAWCAVSQMGRRTMMWVPRTGKLTANLDR